MGRPIGVPVAVAELVDLRQGTHAFQTVEIVKRPSLQTLNVDDRVVARQPAGPALHTAVDRTHRQTGTGRLGLLRLRLVGRLLVLVLKLLEIDRLQDAKLRCPRSLRLSRLLLGLAAQPLGVGMQEQSSHHQAARSSCRHAVTGLPVQVASDTRRRMISKRSTTITLELSLHVPVGGPVPGVHRDLHARSIRSPQTEYGVLSDRRVAVVVLGRIVPTAIRQLLLEQVRHDRLDLAPVLLGISRLESHQIDTRFVHEVLGWLVLTR